MLQYHLDKEACASGQNNQALFCLHAIKHTEMCLESLARALLDHMVTVHPTHTLCRYMHTWAKSIAGSPHNRHLTTQPQKATRTITGFLKDALPYLASHMEIDEQWYGDTTHGLSHPRPDAVT